MSNRSTYKDMLNFFDGDPKTTPSFGFGAEDLSMNTIFDLPEVLDNVKNKVKDAIETREKVKSIEAQPPKKVVIEGVNLDDIIYANYNDGIKNRPMGFVPVKVGAPNRGSGTAYVPVDIVDSANNKITKRKDGTYDIEIGDYFSSEKSVVLCQRLKNGNFKEVLNVQPKLFDYLMRYNGFETPSQKMNGNGVIASADIQSRRVGSSKRVVDPNKVARQGSNISQSQQSVGMELG